MQVMGGLCEIPLLLLQPDNSDQTLRRYQRLHFSRKSQFESHQRIQLSIRRPRRDRYHALRAFALFTGTRSQHFDLPVTACEIIDQRVIPIHVCL